MLVSRTGWVSSLAQELLTAVTENRGGATRNLSLVCSDGVLTWNAMYLFPATSVAVWETIARVGSRCPFQSEVTLLLPDFDRDTVGRLLELLTLGAVSFSNRSERENFQRLLAALGKDESAFGGEKPNRVTIAAESEVKCEDDCDVDMKLELEEEEEEQRAPPVRLVLRNRAREILAERRQENIGANSESGTDEPYGREPTYEEGLAEETAATTAVVAAATTSAAAKARVKKKLKEEKPPIPVLPRGSYVILQDFWKPLSVKMEALNHTPTEDSKMLVFKSVPLYDDECHRWASPRCDIKPATTAGFAFTCHLCKSPPPPAKKRRMIFYVLLRHLALAHFKRRVSFVSN